MESVRWYTSAPPKGGGPLYSSPLAANGALYVTTASHLYAIGAARK